MNFTNVGNILLSLLEDLIGGSKAKYTDCNSTLCVVPPLISNKHTRVCIALTDWKNNYYVTHKYA